MKRMLLFTVALCILLLAGAGVVAAKQDANPRQAGASPVYHFDVPATDTHGPGTLMINLDERKFIFNGKGFEPGQKYILHYSTADSADLRVFVSATATPSGNLHVEGTWSGVYAAPSATGFGVGASAVMTGTIQRAAGEYCYKLTYAAGDQTLTSYLPANEITFGEEGHALPNVIAEPAAVDYVKTYSSTILYVGYQGVPYTARYYASPPYTPPVITVSGSYSPYRTWNDDLKVYDWYWNLHSVYTYDASHLPPGVVLQTVSWWITGTLDDGRTTTRFDQYTQRFPGFPEYGLPPQELALTGTRTVNDGYTWVGCYGDNLCPASEWVTGPPFTAGCTITTTDGNSYTGSALLQAG
ncbi:MAG: hypothetical protein ABFC89_08850 [Methanospirillum sp.]